MTNANDPAMPTLIYDNYSGKPNGHYEGLTKLEAFTKAAMQGLCANSDILNQNMDWEEREHTIGRLSALIAHATIAALNVEAEKEGGK